MPLCAVRSWATPSREDKTSFHRCMTQGGSRLLPELREQLLTLRPGTLTSEPFAKPDSVACRPSDRQSLFVRYSSTIPANVADALLQHRIGINKISHSPTSRLCRQLHPMHPLHLHCEILQHSLYQSLQRTSANHWHLVVDYRTLNPLTEESVPTSATYVQTLDPTIGTPTVQQPHTSPAL